jgi:fucose permease
MNTNTANYLKSTFDISLEQASLGISLYFTALMIGRFSGAVILNWISARPFLIITSIMALAGIVMMIFAPTLLVAQLAIFITGLGSANLFPLVFTIAVNKMPERVNEISGLMIMAVAGGAAIPPVMGYISQNFGAVASLFVLLACIAYVFLSTLLVGKR